MLLLRSPGQRVPAQLGAGRLTEPRRRCSTTIEHAAAIGDLDWGTVDDVALHVFAEAHGGLRGPAGQGSCVSRKPQLHGGEA